MPAAPYPIEKKEKMLKLAALHQEKERVTVAGIFVCGGEKVWLSGFNERGGGRERKESIFQFPWEGEKRKGSYSLFQIGTQTSRGPRLPARYWRKKKEREGKEKSFSLNGVDDGVENGQFL